MPPTQPYSPVPMGPGAADVDGLNELPGVLKMLDGTLFRSESMEIKNDPRFFNGSILEKRLAALGGLSVIAALNVHTSAAIVSLKKEMHMHSAEGILRTVSFAMLTCVLFLNNIALFVGMAQTYHTYRLESAGPTGFEMASSYYLNKNIAAWRHISAQLMLNGLWIFLISAGIRVGASFEALEPHQGKISASWTRGMSLLSLALYTVQGIFIAYLYYKHNAVFRIHHALAKAAEGPHLDHVELTTGYSGLAGRSAQRLMSPDV